MTGNHRPTEAFVVVNLDHASRSAAEIASVLEPLGIPAEIVETGRQLRWHTAVVFRIPEDRTADAMLALAMKGFSDVMAYQANERGG